MTLELDRMAVEEAGASPQRLAAAIHAQLGPLDDPVPVGAVARALDIVEIRVEPLTNLEGALVTGPERGTGQILVNGKSDRRRQRFTIAHELGHFLNPWHAPTSPAGFWCTRTDFITGRQSDQNRHRRQEAEANAFAIELLAPHRKIIRRLAGVPDLDKVLAMSEDCDISREAAARRYVELHREPLAALFCRDDRILYADWKRDFPRLRLRQGDVLPGLTSLRATHGLSPTEDVDPDDWLTQPKGVTLTAQILTQANRHATVLLHASEPDDEEESGIEDAVERFSRISR